MIYFYMDKKFEKEEVMYKILYNKEVAKGIYEMRILAPLVARSAKPGQFVMLIIDEKGERIPLTVVDTDPIEGWVCIVVQSVGYSTNKLTALKESDYIRDFAGPLGKESEFVHKTLEELKDKKIVFVGGGVGAAPVYPQVKYLSERGIRTEVILGFKSAEYIILEKEFRMLNAAVHICTDDGSIGFGGLVTQKLKLLLEKEHIDEVVTIGPMIMMKNVSLLTKEYGVPTVASLNTLMVDGTGMCGGCRVTVGGKTLFTCVDGPEFDAHLIDFDQAMSRQNIYKDEEKHSCRLDGEIR